jgi:uncharacterized membrane protein
MSMPTLTFPTQKNTQIVFGLDLVAAVALVFMVMMRIYHRKDLAKMPFSFMKEGDVSHTIFYLVLAVLLIVALFMLCTSL